MRFDDQARARMRQGLMQRGRMFATVLSDLLAGKQHPQLAALLREKPGLRPEAAVRMALEQTERRRVLLDSGDDAYGRCDVCGEDLGEVAMTEMPWADRCRAHATQ